VRIELIMNFFNIEFIQSYHLDLLPSQTMHLFEDNFIYLNEQ
jgi:hypothetical protein